MMLPKITVEGNLTADPELRFTPQGSAVASFSVAANHRRRADDGSWVDGDSLFLQVSCWDALAENVVESLHKGYAVIIVGNLRQRSYENREGNQRTVYEVTAHNVAASLRNAQAEVKRVRRDQPTQQQQQTADPWTAQPPAPDPWKSDLPNEPPF